MASPDKTTAQRLVTAVTGRDVEEHLRELYVEKRWTDREIAALFGVARSTIRDWREDFGIERADRNATLQGEALA